MCYEPSVGSVHAASSRHYRLIWFDQLSLSGLVLATVTPSQGDN